MKERFWRSWYQDFSSFTPHIPVSQWSTLPWQTSRTRYVRLEKDFTYILHQRWGLFYQEESTGKHLMCNKTTCVKHIPRTPLQLEPTTFVSPESATYTWWLPSWLLTAPLTRRWCGQWDGDSCTIFSWEVVLQPHRKQRLSTWLVESVGRPPSWINEKNEGLASCGRC